MRKKSPSPSTATGSKPTSFKQKSLDSQAIINKTVALNSSLLSAETVQLESFIKSRSKFLDEEIEKMRLKLHTPSTGGNLKADNKGSSYDSRNNRNPTHNVSLDTAGHFSDAVSDEGYRRQVQNRNNGNNHFSDDYSHSGGIDSRKNDNSHPSPRRFRLSPEERKLADTRVEDRRYRDNGGDSESSGREDRGGRDYGEREDDRRIKDKMNILDDREDKYGRKDPREIRVNNQYDTATINQNRRSSTNPRSGGYDERKVEIHPKNGINESFEVGNWARERFGEDEDDDRNNFDSGTFSAFYSKEIGRASCRERVSSPV